MSEQRREGDTLLPPPVLDGIKMLFDSYFDRDQLRISIALRHLESIYHVEAMTAARIEGQR